MRAFAAAAALLAAAAAFADEDAFRSPDGVWIVRAAALESADQHLSRTLHVLRGDREVATFVESHWFQSNPTMRGSTTWSFRLDGRGELVAIERHVELRRDYDAKERRRETTTTTTVEHTWNGAAFVAGKPRVVTTSKTLR